MRTPDMYVVYNRLSEEVQLVKSKRNASKIVLHGNKYFKYSYNALPLMMDKMKSFIKTHSVEKNNIRFCFEASLEEKSQYLKSIFEKETV